MSLQLAFGSFGDFATLVQVIRELATLIRDAVMMRRDIERFATFLDTYSAAISCIEEVLRTGPVYMLSPKILLCIQDALKKASKLTRNFIAYMHKFRSDSWWGKVVIKRMRWALVGKQELTALKEGLISQRDFIQFTLITANL